MHCDDKGYSWQCMQESDGRNGLLFHEQRLSVRR